MTSKKPITDINFQKDRSEKKDHDPRTAKQSQLVSAFDEPRSYPRQEPDNAPISSPVKGRTQNQSKKLQNLTSNISGLGNDPNKFYHQTQNKGEVVDFILSGMSQMVDDQEVKRISGVKHVISATVDVDNLRGTCTGTGRIKIRLNEGEDRETIRQRFMNRNILV